jgi:molybdopterin-containing oxidoreductase family membrane subunit
MRNNIFILNIGCVLIFIGVWIEKGMGLVIPGFIPDTAGEIYEYLPSRTEWIVSLGIFAFGAMTYTLFSRAAIAIDTGKLRHPEAPPVALEERRTIARTVMTKIPLRDTATVGRPVTLLPTDQRGPNIRTG